MSQPIALASIAGDDPNAGKAPSRAAIALVALGAEQAAEVLRHMPEEQAERLSAELATLGAIDEAMLDAVCNDLASATTGDPLPEGGVGFTRDVLGRVVGPQRAEELIRQFMGGDPTPLLFLNSMEPDAIRGLLAGESPQVVAIIVSAVPHTLAGRIIDLLEPAAQADVARRVATMAPPDAALLRDIDRGLREKALALGASTGDAGAEPAPGGVDQLASILQGAGRATERQVLDGLRLVDPELADSVRDKMFTFEDIIKLTDKDLQLVLREVDGKDLVLALRGTAEELTERVLSNMSQRAAETLREDMEMQPPQKRAVVEEAQTQVVTAIRMLEDTGQLTLPSAEPAAGDEPTEVLL